MNDQIQVSLIQRVKTFLGINEECSATELYNRLREYRKQTHPDRYTDKEQKKDAESRFKDTQGLIDELFQFIQDETLQRSPTDLSLQKPLYDNVFMQQELDIRLKEIEKLKQKLEWRERDINKLKKQINDQSAQEFIEERKRLENLYRPKARNWASLGAVLLFSSMIAVMTKVEDASVKFKKYSPIDENILNTIIFIILLIILFLTAKRLLENTLMKQRVRDVCSAKARIEFLKYITDQSESDKLEYFTEYQVFEFIRGKKRWWKVLLSTFGFVHFKTETVDELKDFFIESLLKKELISISHAQSLDRKFSIRSKERVWDL